MTRVSVFNKKKFRRFILSSILTQIVQRTVRASQRVTDPHVYKNEPNITFTNILENSHAIGSSKIY